MKQEHEMTPGVLVSDGKAPDVLVPSVATREMKDAALAELERQGFDCQDFVVQPVYQAMLAAAPAPVERNQCDGCQAGIPVENGMHRMGKPGGYVDLMACTADRYGSAPVERVEQGHDAIALDKARKIIQIMYGDMPKGGSTQLLAMVQVCVLEAMSRALTPQPAPTAAQDVAGLVSVLAAVQGQFKRYGERFPDGFDGRVFRWVDDAIAAHQSGGAK